MDWKTKSRLQTMGNERATALPAKETFGFEYLLKRRDNIFGAYKVRENLQFKVGQLVGSIAILESNFKIPTARNIGRLT